MGGGELEHTLDGTEETEENGGGGWVRVESGHNTAKSTWDK